MLLWRSGSPVLVAKMATHGVQSIGLSARSRSEMRGVVPGTVHVGRALSVSISVVVRAQRSRERLRARGGRVEPPRPISDGA